MSSTKRLEREAFHICIVWTWAHSMKLMVRPHSVFFVHRGSDSLMVFLKRRQDSGLQIIWLQNSVFRRPFSPPPSFLNGATASWTLFKFILSILRQLSYKTPEQMEETGTLYHTTFVFLPGAKIFQQLLHHWGSSPEFATPCRRTRWEFGSGNRRSGACSTSTCQWQKHNPWQNAGGPTNINPFSHERSACFGDELSPVRKQSTIQSLNGAKQRVLQCFSC